MIIIVSGVPGTGKTHLAKLLAKALGYEYIDVNLVIKENNLHEEYDRKRKTFIVDPRKLNKALISLIKKNKDTVIDSHLSHYIPSKYVDYCFITKCSLAILAKRLKRRRYSKLKIKENLEAEIFDVCFTEAAEFGHKVVVVDTTKGYNIKSLLRKIK